MNKDRPTNAGLKMLFPNPPNTNFPKKIETKDPIATTYKGVPIGNVKAKITDVIIGKPFLIILNCKKPYSEEAQDLKQELEKKYKTTVITVNCEQLKMEDINQMIQQLLYEFPISEVEFFYSQMGRNVVEGACN